MLAEILDPKVDERNLRLVERIVIRVLRPVLDAALLRIVMTEEQLHRSRRSDAVQIRFEEWIPVGANGVELVVGIPSDHVEIHVDRDGGEIDGRRSDERQ